jgi:hypothetical protein
MILQLNPAIPLITPKGNAEAIMVIDYSKEDYIYFLCIQDETGELWLWDNTKVRGFKNITLGRTNISEIKK